MNDLPSWQENNDKYLSAALSWLRLRLKHLSPQEKVPVVLPSDSSSPIDPPIAPSEPEKTSWRQRFLGKSASEHPSAPAEESAPNPSSEPLSTIIAPTSSPPATAIETVTDEQISQAAATMAEAEAMSPPPALVMLGQRLGLSRFEREILLLCSAMELDTSIGDLCARAQANINRPYPTFALALSLFDDPAWDVLSPERPLRYWRLLEIIQSGIQPLTASPLHADEKIVNYIKGLNYLDDRLAPLLMPLQIANSKIGLPPSQQNAVDTIVSQLKLIFGNHPLPSIQLLGPDSASKQLVASHAAAALGLHLYRLPAELLPTDVQEMETLARLWERESILLPIALYLDAHDVDGTSVPPVSRFLERSNGIIFLDSRDIWKGLSRAITLDIAKPLPSEQKSAWAKMLGSDAAESPALLAGQFNLNLASIEQLSKAVLARKDGGGSLQDRLWEACLISTRPRLDVLAQRIDAKATWEDIVLPPIQMDLLLQIASQVRNRSQVYDKGGFRRRMNRGLGIGVLFAGESGTGKTMAAEVIANELRLNLYRIDLSQVVSKFIGETEKNLRRLFDAAEDGGAILFFDEADALFGKRSEVKDSHDRYANIEINYLLQRMEAFSGLAILATNMKSALDLAFVRRLRFIVDFPFPGIEERKTIWQKAFPKETKRDELDYERLARFNLTGGSVHNIAINAAFLAVAEGKTVSMKHVLDSAKTEFRKSEKSIIEADFRL